MKPLLVTILCAAVVGLVLLLLMRRSPSPAESHSKAQKPKSAGAGLREMVLTTPAGTLGFSPDADFPKAYGVLTDWGIGEDTATIMSMRDGTASLYTTSTFGIIGGQAHETVQKAAIRYVRLAQQYVDSAKGATEFPYPKTGQVYFYILTYEGVRLCVGDRLEIERGSDPALPLFAAAQDVLTELRATTENQNAARRESGEKRETRHH